MTTNNKTLWKVDPSHSEIGFKVRHMMISTVSGNFTDFDLEVYTDNDEFKNANINFSAKTSSINTQNADRDNHLKSADFFDADQYPEIKFVSESFDGKNLVGQLTIKDVTQPVTLQVDFNGVLVDPYGQTKAGFEVEGKISRKEFGLNWNALTEAGSVVVSDQVRLVMDVQLVKNEGAK